MFHQSQGLVLALKAGNYFARIHAGLDQLERHAAADGFFLLG
jgi:hypothetical protein